MLDIDDYHNNETENVIMNVWRWKKRRNGVVRGGLSRRCHWSWDLSDERELGRAELRDVLGEELSGRESSRYMSFEAGVA